MQDWFASGLVLDIALGVLLLELVALRIWRGAAAHGLVVTLGAGGCLLLAWRFSLSGMAWPWVGAALLAALGLHLVDLAGRLPPAR